MSIRARLFSFAAIGAFICSGSLKADRVTSIHPERELLITAPSVVDSPAAQYPGAWSFGGLMEQLVGVKEAPQRVGDWLASWVANPEVKQNSLYPRLGIVEKIIEPWQRRDGYNPDKGKPWEPNLSHAPFRLLAIVNRMDLCAPAVAGTLREVQESWIRRGQGKEFLKLLGSTGENISAPSGGYGSHQEVSVGEGRLVFGALNPDGTPLEGGWTLIFEYGLKALSDADLQVWAQRWHSLGSLELTDPKYCTRLEAITREFTHRDGSGRSTALGQIRSSEAAFGLGREFREFNADLKSSRLTRTPSPLFSIKNSPEQRLLSSFLHDHDALIRSGVHRLPDQLPDRRKIIPLATWNAFIPQEQPDFFWDAASNVSRDTRRIYSLNTCNGCHAGETGSRDGLHIHPRAEGLAAALSEFLRIDGKPLRLNDPAVRGSKVEYAEMKDREAIFAALLDPNARSMLRELRSVLKERLERTH